jgi:hypothetical protein
MFLNYLGFVIFEKNKHMKKLLFSLLFSVSFIYGYSQEYQFKRIFTNGSLVRVNGEIVISDTLIILKYDGQKDVEYPVVSKATTIGDFNTVYKCLNNANTDQEVRFSLTPSMNNKTRGEVLDLRMDIKDNFTNTTTFVVYYLIPK